ncbi:MAG TPA: cell division protein SepF [Selenomonadales bacterium]|nr:cell division protein SepF [Selenomonadales bacterium]
MALGLIDKLTNFLMPVEEAPPTQELPTIPNRRTQLRVHTPAALKIYIASPGAFDDVRLCADYLRANVAVLINYENTDEGTQQRISDFLNGVSFVFDGSSQRVSETVVLYVPANVDVSKELYAYSLPTYIKKK